MSWVAGGLSLCALILALLPAPILFVGMAIGILAAALAYQVYRNRRQTGPNRLVAAGALTVASMAVAMSATRFLLTWLAIRNFLP